MDQGQARQIRVRRKNQGPAGQIRARGTDQGPLYDSKPRGTDEGPAERSRAPQICSDVLHAPTLRRTFFGLTITKKERVVEIVEGVTLEGPL